MHTQSLVPTIIGSKISLVTCPAADQFGVLTGHAGLVATEFSYTKLSRPRRILPFFCLDRAAI